VYFQYQVVDHPLKEWGRVMEMVEHCWAVVLVLIEVYLLMPFQFPMLRDDLA
jgi:hypothetical protein